MNVKRVGHRSIVDKSTAYGAKVPRFTSRWRQEFINGRGGLIHKVLNGVKRNKIGIILLFYCCSSAFAVLCVMPTLYLVVTG